MKVLLTGASSFTGYWFAKALCEAGCHVVAPLRAAREGYRDGVRAERVRRLADIAEVVDAAPFGGDRFLDLVSAGGVDLLAHHAAKVGDYRSPDFDVAGALADNTRNLRPVLAALAKAGLAGVVLTGSVFEANEGAGEPPLSAFSAYGLSKGFTAELVALRCREIGMPFGKFVIPNPFGPFEEPRFCAYLIKTWKDGQVARVNTPAYVRDNIHVSLLARAYARFCRDVVENRAGAARLNPSGYVESQGVFASRFAAAMRARLDLACGLDLAVQTEFAEPTMRVNFDAALRYVEGWDEAAAWDGIAEFYRA